MNDLTVTETFPDQRSFVVGDFTFIVSLVHRELRVQSSEWSIDHDHRWNAVSGCFWTFLVTLNDRTYLQDKLRCPRLDPILDLERTKAALHQRAEEDGDLDRQDLRTVLRSIDDFRAFPDPAVEHYIDETWRYARYRDSPVSDKFWEAWTAFQIYIVSHLIKKDAQ